MQKTKTTIEYRLREATNGLNGDASYLRVLCNEAAVEIERLKSEQIEFFKAAFQGNASVTINGERRELHVI